MKRCPAMARIIGELLAKHGRKITDSHIHLRLEMEGYQKLVIERVEGTQISVAHYFEQNGDAMRDPEIVFWDGGTGEHFVPVEITQDPVGVYRRVATSFYANGAIKEFAPRGQADIASFAAIWARNIREQGWLDRAKDTTRKITVVEMVA